MCGGERNCIFRIVYWIEAINHVVSLCRPMFNVATKKVKNE